MVELTAAKQLLAWMRAEGLVEAGFGGLYLRLPEAQYVVAPPVDDRGEPVYEAEDPDPLNDPSFVPQFVHVDK